MWGLERGGGGVASAGESLQGVLLQGVVGSVWKRGSRLLHCIPVVGEPRKTWSVPIPLLLPPPRQACKVISAHAGSVGDALLSVPLHCAAGLYAEAVSTLQDAGMWRLAAALTAHALAADHLQVCTTG